MKLLVVLAALSLAGCVHPLPLSETGVTWCMQHQCARSGDDTDRASCEAACRRTYGK